MIVSNASSVSPAYVDNVSGALFTQIGQGSGISVGILAASGQLFQAQMASISGQSIIDGILSATPNGPATRLMLDTYNSTNIFGSSYRGRRSRGTIMSPSGVLAGDILLQLVGDGHNGTGIVNSKASLQFVAAETWSTGSTAAYTAFFTTPTGSTQTLERARISERGYLGVANTNPQYAVDISGGINVTDTLYINGVPLATGGYASAATLQSTGQQLQAQINAIQIFSVAVPTGTVSMAVSFPLSYSTVPQISPTTSAALGIVYPVISLSPTISGYTALFADTVLETGVILTTTAKA